MDMFDSEDMPEQVDPAPPVEDVDTEGQEEYTKQRAKSRKGRKSTILASNSSLGKNTVLG